MQSDLLENTRGSMIKMLDHCSEDVAMQIHDIFQESYQVEAELVGAKEFPPLQRGVPHIRAAKSNFLGLWIASELAAVIEYTYGGAQLSIDSLVVRPQYFRRGLASQLLQSLLSRHYWHTADVETAADNIPAIALYERIEKVQLLYRRSH